MKILLDECLNWRIKRELPEHEVKSVDNMGWKGLKNGDLLILAQEEFDAFITVDKKLPDQQNLKKYDIGVIILRPRFVEISYIIPLIPQVKEALKTIESRKLVVIQ